MRRFSIVCSVFLTLVLLGCPSDWVDLQSVTSHTTPEMNVITSPVPLTTTTTTGPGTSADLLVPFGTQLTLGASAKSPTGVKHLHVTVPNGENIDVLAEARSDGQVPATLVILGSDGSGHVGQRPIVHSMSCDPATLVATAENYQGDQSQLTVNYKVNAPQQTATYDVNPASLPAPGSVKITWTSTNATSVDVDGVGVGAPLNGSKTITLDHTVPLGMTAHAPCRPDVIVGKTVSVGVGPTSGAIVGTYKFATGLGTEQAHLTIRWIGIVVPQGPVGPTNPKMQFDVSTPFTYNPNDPLSVATFQVDNLRNGSWDVTVQPSAIGAPVACHGFLVINNTTFVRVNPNLPTGQQCL